MIWTHRLWRGEHRITYRARRDDPAAELHEAVEPEVRPCPFTETRDVTELGFELDEEKSGLSKADLDNGRGTVHLAGELTLNGVRVRGRPRSEHERRLGHLVTQDEPELAARQSGSATS